MDNHGQNPGTGYTVKARAQDRSETDECEEQQWGQSGCPRMSKRESSWKMRSEW